MNRTLTIAVKRQDRPRVGTRWERFAVDYEPGMNMTTVLQRIAANPRTLDGQDTTPVAYDACCLEEVCGACSMLINGRVRQACSALVENLLEERPDLITLEPMSKFPVIRDLFVDRSQMFEALKTVRAWITADGYFDRGPGPRISQAEQEEAYPLTTCMTCGCCLEACPQFGEHTSFIGAAAISQAVLFNEHPVGHYEAEQRLEVITGPDGIAACGNAQNCAKVCPKQIPLLRSLAKAGRSATMFAVRRFLHR
ncbi:MAG: succinate dehydrogenase iron-sulfur subunit [Planctomycetes bacterium]|nr:succinate dehydrogenase iron-sulfur subunit [Planctomycetota bacterium]